ncbi:MAG: hypothetical protein COZ57_10575 [Armatimonadetes bacterium CG_4_8_14_3_um_filter_66_20]|nr:MAG: hypothetical protein COZ57_10575 [Armatimonadetes bacterium CG_4_8_14_3_um_filter_66_20]
MKAHGARSEALPCANSSERFAADRERCWLAHVRSGQRGERDNWLLRQSGVSQQPIEGVVQHLSHFRFTGLPDNPIDAHANTLPAARHDDGRIRRPLPILYGALEVVQDERLGPRAGGEVANDVLQAGVEHRDRRRVLGHLCPQRAVAEWRIRHAGIETKRRPQAGFGAPCRRVDPQQPAALGNVLPQPLRRGLGHEVGTGGKHNRVPGEGGGLGGSFVANDLKLLPSLREPPAQRLLVDTVVLLGVGLGLVDGEALSMGRAECQQGDERNGDWGLHLFTAFLRAAGYNRAEEAQAPGERCISASCCVAANLVPGAARERRTARDSCRTEGTVCPKEITQMTRRRHGRPTTAPLLLLLGPLCLSGGAEPVAQAFAVAVPPKIDGSLTDKCWQAAPTAGNFTLLGKQQPASQPPEVWLGYTQTHLYIAARMHEDRLDQLVAAVEKRDGPAWEDDCFEVFLAPVTASDRYYAREGWEHTEVEVRGTSPAGVQQT